MSRSKRKPYDHHGKSNSRVYNAWKNMRARCKGFQINARKDYVERGISVCKRWESFNAFYADMGDPPEGMTLDRINNDHGYSKKNCRWATRSQQQLNQRKIVANNKSGVKGVCRENRSGKWLAYFRGKILGSETNFKRAVALRKEAERGEL